MKPKFIESEYFVPEPDNWHLKPGAPKEVQEEFDAWKEECEKALENGVLID